MRDIIIRGQHTTIVGSAITPWVYEGEFDGDMVVDLSTFMDKKSDSKLSAVPKMAWAMAKCAVYPRPFPDYPSWLEQIGGWDHSDELATQGVIFEAMKGCFPDKKGLVSQAEAELEAKRAREQAEPEPAGIGEADGPVAD